MSLTNPHNEHLLKLVGCIRGIVLEFDDKARCLHAWADDPDLLARPAEDLIGRTIDEVLGAAGAPVTAMVHRAYATGTVEHLEYPLDLRGERRWFFADIRRVGSPETGMTVAFFARDITDRKSTEEALARSEERYRLAGQATNDLLWDWDLLRDAVTWNAAVTSVLGYERPGEGSRWWKDAIHPDDRPAVITSIEAALAGDANAWSDRYRFRRADGSYADFVDRGFITRDATGRAVRMVGSMTDVTQINRLQAQLLQADRLAALGTLAAGIGHEINNPLSYVVGNIDTAIAVLDDTKHEVRELLREALGGAQRIADIVKSLRMFTRSDDTSFQSIDVNHVLDAAIKIADKEIRHRARLIRELDVVPNVYANESQLAQVFLNLLINAAQSIEEGNSRQNEICVTTRHEAGGVVITIKDTGCGITPENASRVFDPFFTTKAVGVGTGLGLSICHGIVEKHGGTITASSELGRGSTFTVRLPARVTATGSLPRVLVVDDEIQIGRMIERMFHGKAEVASVTRAREALTRVMSGEHFDLVLCDVMMPEMTGIELYDELRRSHPDVLRRTYFMTGGAFTPTAQEFLRTVGAACIDKPLDRSRLLSLLASV